MNPFAWAMFGLVAIHLLALFAAAKLLGADRTQDQEVHHDEHQ